MYNRTAHRMHRFLSTPSARRATLEPLDLIFPPGISIHALREEDDNCSCP